MGTKAKPWSFYYQLKNLMLNLSLSIKKLSFKRCQCQILCRICPIYCQYFEIGKKNDRTIFDMANRAFVSHIQSYSKHECKYILRLKDLPFGHIATYFGLIKLPKMPELNKRKVEGFTPLKMDWNTIKYKNKVKEESRMEKLSEFEKTGRWPGMKYKVDEKLAWSEKVDKKGRRDERKRIKDLKKGGEEQSVIDTDDEEEFEEDYRLLKKMKKKHNASGAKEDFDKQIQLEKMEDEVDDKPVEPAQA